VAFFTQHLPRGFWPILNMGELAVIYCFVFLYLAAAGGGPWSVEQLWRRNRSSGSASDTLP
jgi:putative oxidoreductase